MPDSFKTNAIIHVVSSLEIGGAERFVIDLCKLQRSNGENVAILSFGSIDDPLIDECKNSEIMVYHTAKGRIKKWQSALAAIMPYKVVHFHSPYPLRFLLPIMPMCIFKTVVYTRHGADSLAGKNWYWMHKFARFFVNKISFVSQEGAVVFTQSHGWLKHKKYVIDNGVNLADIHMSKVASDKFRIGSVGRMVELKHQISLLQAVSKLDNEVKQIIEIHFYGYGPCFEQLNKFVEQHQLHQQVFFHGMVSDRSQIYNSFDVLVVTSETEGLSLAIIEAMAHYCPIIATNVGGNPKLVSHDSNGYLFEYNDVCALAEKIEQLMNNLESHILFGQNSRKKIEDQFSLLACAKKYQQLYND